VVPAATGTVGESQPTIEPWESPTGTPDYGWSSEPTSSTPLPGPIRAEPVRSGAEPTITAPPPEPEQKSEAAGSGSGRRGSGRRRGRNEAPVPSQEPTPEPAPIPRQRAKKAQQRAEQVPQQQAQKRAEPARPPADEPKPSGRRSRRRAEDSQPHESDYVDWVKGLGGADSTVRVGGNARHAKPTDRPGKG
jgi:hypothetical protein